MNEGENMDIRWNEPKVLHLFCLFCGIPLMGKSYILIPFFVFLYLIWNRRNWLAANCRSAFRAVPEFRYLTFFLSGYGLFALIGFFRMPGSLYTRTDGPLYAAIFAVLLIVGFVSGSWEEQLPVREKAKIFSMWIQAWGWIIGIDVLLKRMKFPYLDLGIVNEINALSTLFLILAPLSLLSFFSKRGFLFRSFGFLSFCFFSWLLFFCTTSDVRYVYWLVNLLVVYFFHRSESVRLVPVALFFFLAALMAGYSDEIVAFLKSIDLFQAPFGEGKVPFFQKILNTRDAIWQGSLRAFGEHYWWGVGPANFHEYVTPYLLPLKQYFRRVPHFWQAHNIFLHIFVVTGVWGGLCFLFSALVQVRIATRLLLDEKYWLLGIGIFIVTLTTYLYGLFEPVVYNDALLAFIWGGLGYAVACLHKRKKTAELVLGNSGLLNNM